MLFDERFSRCKEKRPYQSAMTNEDCQPNAGIEQVILHDGAVGDWRRRCRTCCYTDTESCPTADTGRETRKARREQARE